MRAVIKTVSAAAVTIKTDLVASINRGLCVLVGFHKDDTEEDLAYMVKKIMTTPLFGLDGNAKSSCVIVENFEILCVNQPTLFAVIRENGVQYPDAMADELSEKFFDMLVRTLQKVYRKDKVKNSPSGDYMEVHFENDDGGETLMLDSRDK